jgi:hypothetical protein
LGLVVSDEGKMFYNTDTWMLSVLQKNLFFFATEAPLNKLECFSTRSFPEWGMFAPCITHILDLTKMFA